MQVRKCPVYIFSGLQSFSAQKQTQSKARSFRGQFFFNSPIDQIYAVNFEVEPEGGFWEVLS